MKLNNALLSLALSLLAISLQAAEPIQEPCERACLYDIADQYFAAMLKGDISSAPLAGNVKFSENGVVMALPDALWNTIDGVRGYDLKLADPERGQVARIDVVTEHGVPAILAARFKVEDRLITEVETVLSRRIDNSPFPVTEGYEQPHPQWSATVPTEKRMRRERMISVADGYFDTLQQNDGTLFTHFHEDCERVENGLQTTHNDTIPDYDIAQMGCAEQFELGQYIYDDRLRDRRFPLVDVEKGVVLAAGYMDHSGSIVDVTWTNGRKAKSVFFYPHSFVLMELFKVEDNAIRRVEAVFASMPYNIPSAW